MFAFRAAHEEKDSRRKLDLRDDGGERVLAPRRTAARAAITEQGLRRQVLRDLESLMNTVAFESTVDLAEHPEVRKSVLNFGCPDISNRTIDESRLSEIRDELETALSTFEPRLVRDTIEVARDNEVDKTELRLRYVVRADLMCTPVNVPVEFFADVEFDTGSIVVSRL
ncbi:MAG: type VI secretion system baseplate subunit TssE [Methylobacteriaceae bacterium]|nr:type VI secretion system baseplate subunit TssE [Methylobacteriaceae bacterium]